MFSANHFTLLGNSKKSNFENQFYIPDFRFNFTLLDLSEDEVYELYVNGNFKITATRAKFQHSNLPNTTVRIQAMHELRDGLSRIKFEKPSPMKMTNFTKGT